MTNRTFNKGAVTMEYTEKTLKSDIIFEGRIITVKNDTVELVNGKTSFREVVEHNGGVGIIPVDADGNIYLVRQFRYPFMETTLEIPAGKLEKGEEPFACAVRELSEETGFTAGKYDDLGKFYPSPGYCKEILYIYMARELTGGRIHLDENEFLDVVKMPLDEAVAMVMRGELYDAKTIIAILKAKQIVG
jgi:ADP-ribose pyrophosphatase